MPTPENVRALGRIGGPLLADNLRRNGVDLAFETDLIYLDVNNGRIGIRNGTPTRTVDITGTTNISDSVQVDSQLDVANLTFLGHEISNIVGKIYLQPNQSTDPEIVTTKIGTANLRISDKLIENITPDSDINFTANGTGQVKFTTTRVNVDGNLHATGAITFDGDITFGDSDLDNVSFSADINSNIIPDVDNTWDLGAIGKTWREIYTNTFSIGTTQTANLSVIQTLVSNGTNEFYGSSHQFGLNSSVPLTFVAGVNSSIIPTGSRNLGSPSYQWNTLYVNSLDTNSTLALNNLTLTSTGAYIAVPDIKIQDNVISATALNNDLIFTGLGTGGVVVDNWLKFKDNEISNVNASPTTDTSKSIIFAPNGTGQVNIDSTHALVLPLGNNTTRVLSQVGELRYNTTANLVEGWSPNGRVYLNNVYDGDRNTYITPELTPGTNDNIIRFGINGTVKATISSTKLYDNTMHVDNIRISNLTIDNLVSSNDTILEPNGTGSVNVNNVLFKDNTLTNTLDTALTLSSTGTGYVKFGGTAALVVPVGNNSQRPATPDQGTTRYNTEMGYLEIWTGTAWIPTVGTTLAISQTEVEQILDEWTLILG